MQLVVTLDSGDTLTFGTDESWRSTPSHILGADLIAGEVHDLRRRADWRALGDLAAGPCDEDHGFDRAVRVTGSARAPHRGHPARRPCASSHPGRWVVDFGQNINGWIRLADLGPGRHRAHPRPTASGSTRTATSPRTTSPIAALVPRSSAIRPVPGRPGDRRRHRRRRVRAPPQHQGVPVRAHRGPSAARSTADDITGSRRAHRPRAPSAASSARTIASTPSTASPSGASADNACDIPTDCPTRERAGWTGDWQIFVDTAAFLYDVGGFSVKWLRDLAAEQRADGKVTNLVPDPTPATTGHRHLAACSKAPPVGATPRFTSRGPSTAPPATARCSPSQWDSAKALGRLRRQRGRHGRHPSRIERSAEPAPHERYLWDSGWHFGEWLEAGENLDDAIAARHGRRPRPRRHRVPPPLGRRTRRSPRRSDEPAMPADYADLAANVADAWRTEFLDDDGTTTPDTQANLCPRARLRPRPRRAARRSRRAGSSSSSAPPAPTSDRVPGHPLPATGPRRHRPPRRRLRAPVPGHRAVLAHMVDRGATTVWEDWGGVDADGTPHASLNHYSKGAVISFLHQYVAGLQLVEPGYRRFRVAPRPGGGITWRTRRPRLAVRQHRGRLAATDGHGVIDITVPPGTEAELVLPDAVARHPAARSASTHVADLTRSLPAAD